jgi:hypothetical protein
MSAQLANDGPKSMVRPTSWSQDVEEAYRFQLAGYRDETEYKNIQRGAEVYRIKLTRLSNYTMNDHFTYICIGIKHNVVYLYHAIVGNQMAREWLHKEAEAQGRQLLLLQQSTRMSRQGRAQV